MVNHPNRGIPDKDIALIKAMLLAHYPNQSIQSFFGGKYNSGRIAEINHSINRQPSLTDKSLTRKARGVSPAHSFEIPTLEECSASAVDMRRERAALRAFLPVLRAFGEKCRALEAMIGRVVE